MTSRFPFLVFAGNSEPRGGMCEYVGAYPTVAAALEYVRNSHSGYGWMQAAQVTDMGTLATVAHAQAADNWCLIYLMPEFPA